jgi:serine/threonine protein kinase
VDITFHEDRQSGSTQQIIEPQLPPDLPVSGNAPPSSRTRSSDAVTAETPTAGSHSVGECGVDNASLVYHKVEDHSRRMFEPPEAVHSSLLASGFTRRLCQRLPSFEPPTVIHRTNNKVRVKISNFDGSSSFISRGKKHDMFQKGTNPSAFTNPSESPLFSHMSCQSTLDGMTPSLALSSTQKRMTSEQSWSLFPRFGEKGFTTDQSSVSKDDLVKLNPTIITVEATAIAKIFFENHFNSLFKGPDTRSQRFQELEEQLSTLAFTAEERERARKIWVAQESEYLRRTRVLKTRSNRIHPKKSVSIAGYEIIRVLGRGSFGVVRLVKDKTDSSKGGQREVDKYATQHEAPETNRSHFRHAFRYKRVAHGTDRREKNMVYAMKVIRKSDMIRLAQEGNLRAERDFLVASERSKWIVPLTASFQDKDHLYLVMDYMVGGDFFGLLLREGVLSESNTKWYVAEMILCIEEAHKLGWIHRDVKPENFLIAASGQLKIADFGLAFDGHWAHNQAYFHNHRTSLLEKLGLTVKGDNEDRIEAEKLLDKCPLLKKTTCRQYAASNPKGGQCPIDRRNQADRRRLARSIVGTSQYMAPEIILGEHYDGRCDWWSLGIILYEVYSPLLKSQNRSKLTY